MAYLDVQSNFLGQLYVLYKGTFYTPQGNKTAYVAEDEVEVEQEHPLYISIKSFAREQEKWRVLWNAKTAISMHTYCEQFVLFLGYRQCFEVAYKYTNDFKWETLERLMQNIKQHLYNVRVLDILSIEKFSTFLNFADYKHLQELQTRINSKMEARSTER